MLNNSHINRLNLDPVEVGHEVKDLEEYSARLIKKHVQEDPYRQYGTMHGDGGVERVIDGEQVL